MICSYGVDENNPQSNPTVINVFEIGVGSDHIG